MVHQALVSFHPGMQRQDKNISKHKMGREEEMVKVKDPVCGMEIDPKQAAASESYQGKTHPFCSTACHDKFNADPEKYAQAKERG